MSVSSEQIEAAQKWAADFYTLLDAGDFHTLTTKYLKEDVTFTYTNYPTVKGRDAVANILGASSTATSVPVKSMKHTIVDLVVIPTRLMVGIEGSFEFTNGETAFLRGFIVFFKNADDQQASDYRVYGDFSPLTQVKA